MQGASKSNQPVSGRRALQSLNFFMADMQAGVGPFLGVFLLAHGWQSGWIGSVMTLGAVAGVLMTAPAGAWVDTSQHKRWLVAFPGACTVLASAVILLSQSFWPIALSQVATAIAGAAIGPAEVWSCRCRCSPLSAVSLRSLFPETVELTMDNAKAVWLYPLILAAGAGAFAGLTITANILMSLIIDKYGVFGMQTHELNWPRMVGAGLMVGGIFLINRF